MGYRSIRWAKGFGTSAAVATLCLAAPPVYAQPPVPQGTQFQVNTYTLDVQHDSSVATGPDGSFVVVWTSYDSPDDSLRGIQGQRFASNGSAVGAQFQVNTFTLFNQLHPSVAAAADGNFVVVWDSDFSAGDPDFESIQGQRFASNGSAVGPQFQVNTYTTNSQDYPSVAANAQGSFVVVWQSSDLSGTDTSGLKIQGQRYASNGLPNGTQFQVNTYTTSNQFDPSVALATGGDFVVVWGSIGSYGTGSSETDTSSVSIQGQRYDSNGLPKGTEFQVNTYTTGQQYRASVAGAGDGDFVVIWQSSGSSGSDTSSQSIQGQRYASNGLPKGTEFQVNTYTTSAQEYPSVAAAGDDDFVVVWQSDESSGTDTNGTSVHAKRYASNGLVHGGQFQVNTYTTNHQFQPAIATTPDGGLFVVAWDSYGSPGTDTSFVSVQAQRYSVIPFVPALSPSMGIALVATLMLIAAYALRRRA